MDRQGDAAAVILNYRDNRRTLRLVEILQTCADIVRICVVDNAKSGGLTGEEKPLRAENVLFLRTVNKGYSLGNNFGISALQSRYGLPPYLMIANPDIDITCATVSQCIAFLREHSGFGLAAPRMLCADGTPHDLPGWRRRTVYGDLAYSSGILARLIGMRHEAYPAAYWDDKPFVRVDCAAGACFFIQTKAFQDCGYFDPHSFLFYEEDILGEKLRGMGLGEAVCTDCTYRHLEGVSSHISLKKYRIMQRSRLYFHRKYRHAGSMGMLALYAATALGTCECLLKQALLILRLKKS